LCNPHKFRILYRQVKECKMEYHWSDDFDTYEEWVKHEEKDDS